MTVPGEPGPARYRRALVFLVAGVLLPPAIVAATVIYSSGDDQPGQGLTVTWGGAEGKPSCVYDPGAETVDARLTIKSSRTVEVEGTVHMPLVVTIPVERAPQVGEDSETACSLSVKD